MIDLKQFTSNLDEYTVKARLKPAFLVVLPVLFSILGLFPDGITGLSATVSLFVLAGGSVLLAQMAREWGKHKQPELYKEWGGQPSIRMLRHRDATNKQMLARYHAKLKAILPEVKIPTAEEEKFDPQGADDSYDACCSFLRTKTRDKKKFPLVFQENVNYGFRRNLWGMRCLGIVASIAGLLVIGTAAAFHWKEIPKTLWLYGVIDLLLLLSWIFVFTKSWVKTAADAYGERLLESCDRL